MYPEIVFINSLNRVGYIKETHLQVRRSTLALVFLFRVCWAIKTQTWVNQSRTMFGRHRHNNKKKNTKKNKFEQQLTACTCRPGFKVVLVVQARTQTSKYINKQTAKIHHVGGRILSKAVGTKARGFSFVRYAAAKWLIFLCSFLSQCSWVCETCSNIKIFPKELSANLFFFLNEKVFGWRWMSARGWI